MNIFSDFIGKVEQAIINPLITLLAIAAFTVFVWGVVDFIANAGNEETRQTGQQHILWGSSGLVIIFAAKAIVTIAANRVGVPVPDTIK